MEKFWKKYIKSDMLGRLEISKELWKKYIKPSLKDYDILDEEKRDYACASFLNSYFEDLISVMESEKNE